MATNKISTIRYDRTAKPYLPNDVAGRILPWIDPGPRGMPTPIVHTDSDADGAYLKARLLIARVEAELDALRAVAAAMPANDDFTKNLLGRIDRSMAEAFPKTS
jgi:hypothetical protein